MGKTGDGRMRKKKRLRYEREKKNKIGYERFGIDPSINPIQSIDQ